MDKRFTFNFRNRPHIDGSFLSKETDYYFGNHHLHTGDNNQRHDERDEDRLSAILLPTPKKSLNTLTLDWKDDPEMSKRGGFDIVEAISPDGIYDLMERGRKFGRILEEKGAFETLPRI